MFVNSDGKSVAQISFFHAQTSERPPQIQNSNFPNFYAGYDCTLDGVLKAFPDPTENNIIFGMLLRGGARIAGRLELFASELGAQCGRPFRRAVTKLQDAGVLLRIAVGKSYEWALDIGRLSELVPKLTKELSEETRVIDAKRFDILPKPSSPDYISARACTRGAERKEEKEKKEEEQIEVENLQIELDFSTDAGFFSVQDKDFLGAFIRGIKQFQPKFSITKEVVKELSVLLYQYGRKAFEASFVKIVRDYVRDIIPFFTKCLERHKDTHHALELNEKSKKKVQEILSMQIEEENPKKEITLTEEMQIILSGLRIKSGKEVGNQIELEILDNLFQNYSYSHIKTALATMHVYDGLNFPIALLKKECEKLARRKLGRNCKPEAKKEEVEAQVQEKPEESSAEIVQETPESVFKTQEERDQEDIDRALGNIIQVSTRNLDQASDELVTQTNKALISRLEELKAQKLSDWAVLLVKISMMQQDIFEEFIEKSDHSTYLKAVKNVDDAIYYGRIKKSDRQLGVVEFVWRELGLPYVGEKFLKAWATL